MSDILLFGTNGFIGRNLYKYLKKEFSIIGLGGKQAVDLIDYNQVKQCINTVDPKIIILAAGVGGKRIYGDDVNTIAHNIAMLNNILKARNIDKQLVIYFGSGAEFDRTNNIHEREEYSMLSEHPADYYGLSKKMQALMCYAEDNIVNLRLFGCFGIDEEEQRFILSSIKHYIRQEPINIQQNKYFDFFYIKDLCKIVKLYVEEYLTRQHGYSIMYTDSFYQFMSLSYEDKFTLVDIANEINLFDFHTVPINVAVDGCGLSYCGNSKTLDEFVDINNMKLTGLLKGIREVYEYHKKLFLRGK